MASSRVISLAAVNEDEGALKRLFAAALLRDPHDVVGAGRRAFPGKTNHGRAIEASQTWPTDPVVLAILEELTSDEGLPSREHVAREVWARAMDPEAADKDRIAAFKLYSEIMGSLKPEHEGLETSLNEIFRRIEQDGRPRPPSTD